MLHALQFAFSNLFYSRDSAVVRSLASHQCGPGMDSQTRRYMWVEFCFWFSSLVRGFFSGYSGFPPSTKTNTYKFQFDRKYTALQSYSFYPYYVLIKVLIMFLNFFFRAKTVRPSLARPL